MAKLPEWAVIDGAKAIAATLPGRPAGGIVTPSPKMQRQEQEQRQRYNDEGSVRTTYSAQTCRSCSNSPFHSMLICL
jgi:hypothetical protein